MLGAATMDEVAGGVELFAPDAVIGFVRPLVQVTPGCASSPEAFHCRGVPLVDTRPNEVVEGQAERVPECLEA
jgi:hypothetical protein